MSISQAPDDIAELQRLIGYPFKNPGLLITALQAPTSDQYDGVTNRKLALVGHKALELALLEHWFFESVATLGTNPLRPPDDLIYQWLILL